MTESAVPCEEKAWDEFMSRFFPDNYFTQFSVLRHILSNARNRVPALSAHFLRTKDSIGIAYDAERRIEKINNCESQRFDDIHCMKSGVSIVKVINRTDVPCGKNWSCCFYNSICSRNRFLIFWNMPAVNPSSEIKNRGSQIKEEIQYADIPVWLKRWKYKRLRSFCNIREKDRKSQ